MQHFDLTLAPGAVRTIDVAGSYAYFLSGSAGGADTTIALRNETGGDTVLLRPGQAFKLGNGMQNTRWVISNYRGEGTIVGVLLMGAGEFHDSRISGAVEVIDGGKNRTAAGVAFLAYANGAAVAGCYPHQQLWNPAGSGKNLIVSKVMFSSATTQVVRISSNSVQLPSLSTAPQCKRIGGGAGVGQTRYQNNSAAILGAVIYNAGVVANTPQYVKFEEPIIVPPGYGLLTVGGSIETDLPTNFEYYEEPI